MIVYTDTTLTLIQVQVRIIQRAERDLDNLSTLILEVRGTDDHFNQRLQGPLSTVDLSVTFLHLRRRAGPPLCSVLPFGCAAAAAHEWPGRMGPRAELRHESAVRHPSTPTRRSAR